MNLSSLKGGGVMLPPKCDQVYRAGSDEVREVFLLSESLAYIPHSLSRIRL